jgi:hypothetical protein
MDGPLQCGDRDHGLAMLIIQRASRGLFCYESGERLVIIIAQASCTRIEGDEERCDEEVRWRRRRRDGWREGSRR